MAITLRSVLTSVLGFLTVGAVLRFRATSRRLRAKPFFFFEDEVYTYGETYRQAERYARLFDRIREERVAAGRLGPGEPLPVAIYQENNPEYVFAYFGAALSGDTVFNVNTGFRGDMLASVLEKAAAPLVIADATTLAEVERVLTRVPSLEASRVFLARGAGAGAGRPLAAALAEAETAPPAPRRRVRAGDPYAVIYTSGTTGSPKGVVCSHFKIAIVGIVCSRRIGLRADDRGYVCMPLFHSNSLYLGIMPLLTVGGSFVLKPKFSASAFERDILEHGCTYMNYVGQPLHYIVLALERKYGSEEAIVRALARDPRNRFRIAQGNGALPADQAKLKRYLGMEHIYELYGSTEAAISTVLRPGDPEGSLGEVRSKSVMIVDENGRPCPPGRVDEKGNLVNYDEAVGEIVRKLGKSNIFFDGYFQNERATEGKYRDGFYRSGDLGHIRVIGGKRYLYFDGRTDDWIRKDGENFSAENVTQAVMRHPDVELALAFGAPSEVADEKVMVAIQLREGRSFDPRGFYEFFERAQREGGLDPKWIPDYVRVVPRFEMTETQKIRVRALKREHFDIARFDDPVFFRERGDTAFRRLDRDALAALERRFEAHGRTHLLRREQDGACGRSL